MPRPCQTVPERTRRRGGLASREKELAGKSGWGPSPVDVAAVGADPDPGWARQPVTGFAVSIQPASWFM
jgi:hypothetical protein